MNAEEAWERFVKSLPDTGPDVEDDTSVSAKLDTIAAQGNEIKTILDDRAEEEKEEDAQSADQPESPLGAMGIGGAPMPGAPPAGGAPPVSGAPPAGGQGEGSLTQMLGGGAPPMTKSDIDKASLGGIGMNTMEDKLDAIIDLLKGLKENDLGRIAKSDSDDTSGNDADAEGGSGDAPPIDSPPSDLPFDPVADPTGATLPKGRNLTKLIRDFKAGTFSGDPISSEEWSDYFDGKGGSTPEYATPHRMGYVRRPGADGKTTTETVTYGYDLDLAPLIRKWGNKVNDRASKSYIRDSLRNLSSMLDERTTAQSRSPEFIANMMEINGWDPEDIRQVRTGMADGVAVFDDYMNDMLSKGRTDVSDNGFYEYLYGAPYGVDPSADIKDLKKLSVDPRHGFDIDENGNITPLGKGELPLVIGPLEREAIAAQLMKEYRDIGLDKLNYGQSQTGARLRKQNYLSDKDIREITTLLGPQYAKELRRAYHQARSKGWRIDPYQATLDALANYSTSDRRIPSGWIGSEGATADTEPDHLHISKDQYDYGRLTPGFDEAVGNFARDYRAAKGNPENLSDNPEEFFKEDGKMDLPARLRELEAVAPQIEGDWIIPVPLGDGSYRTLTAFTAPPEKDDGTFVPQPVDVDTLDAGMSPKNYVRNLVVKITGDDDPADLSKAMEMLFPNGEPSENQAAFLDAYNRLLVSDESDSGKRARLAENAENAAKAVLGPELDASGAGTEDVLKFMANFRNIPGRETAMSDSLIEDYMAKHGKIRSVARLMNKANKRINEDRRKRFITAKLAADPDAKTASGEKYADMLSPEDLGFDMDHPTREAYERLPPAKRNWVISKVYNRHSVLPYMYPETDAEYKVDRNYLDSLRRDNKDVNARLRGYDPTKRGMARNDAVLESELDNARKAGMSEDEVDYMRNMLSKNREDFDMNTQRRLYSFNTNRDSIEKLVSDLGGPDGVIREYSRLKFAPSADELGYDYENMDDDEEKSKFIKDLARDLVDQYHGHIADQRSEEGMRLARKTVGGAGMTLPRFLDTYSEFMPNPRTAKEDLVRLLDKFASMGVSEKMLDSLDNYRRGVESSKYHAGEARAMGNMELASQYLDLGTRWSNGLKGYLASLMRGHNPSSLRWGGNAINSSLNEEYARLSRIKNGVGDDVDFVATPMGRQETADPLLSRKQERKQGAKLYDTVEAGTDGNVSNIVIPPEQLANLRRLQRRGMVLKSSTGRGI